MNRRIGSDDSAVTLMSANAMLAAFAIGALLLQAFVVVNASGHGEYGAQDRDYLDRVVVFLVFTAEIVLVGCVSGPWHVDRLNRRLLATTLDEGGVHENDFDLLLVGLFTQRSVCRGAGLAAASFLFGIAHLLTGRVVPLATGIGLALVIALVTPTVDSFDRWRNEQRVLIDRRRRQAGSQAPGDLACDTGGRPVRERTE